MPNFGQFPTECAEKGSNFYFKESKNCYTFRTCSDTDSFFLFGQLTSQKLYVTPCAVDVEGQSGKC
jgi:hypothetical protein